MALIQVQLGDFVFKELEVPERIPFGGEQSLIVHKLIGGKRVIDAMGRDEAPIEWDGWLMGQDAQVRALYLDGLRVAGQPLLLTWAQWRYLVVIRRFEADFHFVGRIRYRIVCEVAENQSLPTGAPLPDDIDSVIGSDMDTANGLGTVINDGPLSIALGTLNTPISAVSSFANAAQSTINSVLQPIAAVQSRVQVLLASVVNTTQNVATVGGILPGTPIAQSVANLGAQAAAFTTQPSLISLQNVMGRMSANLGNVSGNVVPTTVAGGNLYSIAAKQYGDATAWTGIAKANGLTDPVLSGVHTISVPILADQAGGVLGQ